MTDTVEMDRRSTLRQQLADGELVNAYGSDLRRTRILRTGAEDYLWCVSPIDGDPHDPAIPGVSVPLVVNDEYVYRTHGAQSLAKRLQVEESDAIATAAMAIEALMPALATVHVQPSPLPSLPPGLGRLVDWLDGPADTDYAGEAAQLRLLAEDRWGHSGWRQLAEWARELGRPAAPVHGNFSMGAIVPAAIEDRTVLLAEPVSHTGAPELDLGWILGELIEYRALKPGRIRAQRIRGLQETVLRAYPGGWDAERVAIAALVRIATHARDFAALFGWNPALLLYVELCHGLLAAIRTGNRAFLATNVLGVPTRTKGG